MDNQTYTSFSNISNQTIGNESSSDDRKTTIHNLDWDAYIKIAAYMLLFVIGSFMNFVSLVYFGFHGKRCRSNYRYFIAHLSFADLLCCLVVPFFIIVSELNGGSWILGEFTCKYIYPIGRISANISAWILCGMTYERYRAFTDPFRKLHKKSIKVFLVGVWICSIIAMLFYSLFSVVFENNKCTLGKSTAILIIGIVKINFKITIPSIIMTSLYIKLKLFLTAQNKEREKNLQSKMKTEKSEKMILYSVVTYLVCVLPLLGLGFYIDVILQNKGESVYLDHEKYYYWFLFLFHANSAINVFIYAGKFRDFRKFIFEKLRLVLMYRRHQEVGRRNSMSSSRTSNITAVSSF